MCEPTTVLLVAGMAVSAYGQVQSGKYNKSVSKQNAEIGQAQARDAELRGSEAEQSHITKVRQMLGAQRARLGGSGSDANTGSALTMQTDTLKMGATDALTIRNNAASEAWGHRVDASNSLAQGRLKQSEANYGAAGTILTGGAQAYGTYRSTKEPKV